MNNRELTGLTKELEGYEITNTCMDCECAGCENLNCSAPCRANIPCDVPVTNCTVERM
jgi:hypothetical protein